MTGIVVEVGPATIRGPNHADAEWISAGIDGIDDELTLIDECPVTVADVWRTVMHDVVGGSGDTIALVCPTWWASSRVDRVRDAAGAVANDVVVLRRAQALRDGLSDRPLTVVEIAPEFVVVSLPGGDIQVVAHGDADGVVTKIPVSIAVVVDGPEGVEGGRSARRRDRSPLAGQWGCRHDLRSRLGATQRRGATVRGRGPRACGSSVDQSGRTGGCRFGQRGAFGCGRLRWIRGETRGAPVCRRHADDAVGRRTCRCDGAGALGGPAGYVGAWIGTGAGRFA